MPEKTESRGQALENPKGMICRAERKRKMPT
jgi:hypothetical protein